MTGPIGGLIDAAKAARKLSVAVGTVGLDIEIVITEIGLVVRGRRWVGDLVAKSQLDLDWSEFYASPALLRNQVRLVNDALLAKAPEGV